MRDENRLHEKIQLSLEDRHLALLAVCALVLLGGVFALGLLVGKQLAASAPPAVQPGELLALDAQSTVAPSAPKPAPPKAALPEPKAKAELKAEVRSSSASLAAADEGPVSETVKLREEAPPREAPARSTAKAKVMIESAPRAVAIDPPPKTVQIARPVGLTLRRAMLTPPPAVLGEYTVQIGASQDQVDAQRLEAKARGAGLKSYVVEVNLGERGTWYRIRVGAFSNRDAANRFRKDVERELRISAVVMSSR